MMTSSRPRNEVSGSFSSRRGHASQLSISDPSHHVTEAIGTLYGDEDDSGSDGGRPLSFITGPSHSEHLQRSSSLPESHEHRDFLHQVDEAPERDQPFDLLTRQNELGSPRKHHNILIPSPSQRSSSPYDKQPASPPLSLRNVQADSTGSQFPLTNIDNPSDIAQELSNLQALRRLSMDVGSYIDPDMPLAGLSTMPTAAPSGDDDENDPSRLLWVPARVHPELAPTEFKTFLEKRVQSIRRRSGDPFLAFDSDQGSSLKRNKSMLSRQIDNTGGKGAIDYVDGAERLERQRSTGSQHNPEVSLEDLVKDPTKAVQRLAQESQGAARGNDDGNDDMPILPMAPGKGLRRSTRTTYRKGGSFRSGDQSSLSRRLAHRQSDGEPTDATSAPSTEGTAGSTARSQSEPIADIAIPARSLRRQGNLIQDPSSVFSSPEVQMEEATKSHSSLQNRPDQHSVNSSSIYANTSTKDFAHPHERSERQENENSRTFPRRSSSQNTKSHREHHVEVKDEGSSRPARRSGSSAAKQTVQPQYMPKSPNSLQNQQMSDPLVSPSSLTSGDASRTDNLTFIPTLAQPEKKSEKRSKKDRDDDSSTTSSRSGSAWKWLKGVADDRDKKKDEHKKAKARISGDKSQDNARLDVIQTSIDKTSAKGRESLVLDRDNVDTKLLEERKKESNRKSDSKRDKDGSIFSSIFGGSKRKEEKERVSKKSQHLQVPEDIPYKPLIPDVDYNWTRFPLLEERAIYRMAHIKLANPRRSLLSQVLLSNFMYSYLAIVQAMHPQMNVPTSPQQKRLEEEARRKRQEQEYLARLQTQGETDTEPSLDQYNFDYHRAAVQYAETGAEPQVDYVDDAQIYEDEHGDERHDGYGYESTEGYSRDMKDYSHRRDNEDEHRSQGRDDMW